MELPVFNIIYVINSETGILRNPADEHVGHVNFAINTPSTGLKPSGVLTADETLESILRERHNIPFAVKVQIFDICCTEVTRTFAEKYLRQAGDKVQYFERKGRSICQCYNEGLDKSEDASWVNMMRASACYDGEVFSEIFENAREFDVSMVSLAPSQYMNGKVKSQLFYKRRSCVIELEEDPYCTNFCLDSLFIERKAIGALRFDESIPYDAVEVFLVQLYEQIKRYMIMRKPCRVGEYFATDAYNFEPEYEKNWYTTSVRSVYIPFLKEKQDSIIRQASMIYFTELRFWANGNDRNKAVLTKTEQEEFYSAVVELFQLIDDDVISQYRWTNQKVLQKFMGMNFLRMKYGDYGMEGNLEIRDEEPLIVCGENHTAVTNLNNIELNVMAINYEQGFLKIDGEVANVYFADHSKIHFYALLGDEKIPAERNQIYSYAKYFGLPVKKGYMVQVKIPKEKLHHGQCFQFVAEFQGYEVTCKCFFKKIQSHLYNGFRKCYWKFGKFLLKYNEETSSFRVETSFFVNHLLSELRFWLEIGEIKGIGLRCLYFLTRPIYKKRNIWITFDQLFKGGDNGEYFFRYVRENHKDDVDMYYVANPDSKEYSELSEKYGNVLKYRSLKLLLATMHAKMIFATRVDVRLYCGFSGYCENCSRDLFNAEIVCLQHGLTIQKIAQYQNRLFDNLKYYFCVSPYEVENILKPIYGYTPEMLKLTGAPRYDGLVGTPKRQILITPTWRRNVTAGTNQKGSNHKYSVNFKNTTYFKIYNTLINDKRLIECAKKTNYKLIYLIHPILSPQVDDFDKNEFVEIDPGINVNYEKILKESSLMVTDYSGIQFDFAYMRRPLIYYHPDELPPQYDAGNLDYNTMGFGPVCKTNDEVVEALCHFMEQDCRLDELYRERIEEFFPFDDQNNCQRVYEAAIAYQKNLDQR